MSHDAPPFRNGYAPPAGQASPASYEALQKAQAPVDPHTPGAKLDNGKVRPSLVIDDMARAINEVAKVATFGANKYSEGGWVQVPNGFKRYRDAQRRHALAFAKGETHDAESQLLHLAHEAWNALAKLDLYLREQEKAAEWRYQVTKSLAPWL